METKVFTKNHLFTTKEEYLNFKTAWSKLAKEKKITTTMILFYNVVRGKKFKRGFTPVTNQNKLSNGAKPDQAFNEALWTVRRLAQGLNKWVLADREQFISQFGGTVSPELMNTLDQYINGEATKQGLVL
jgi:hypothetical protein